jgi:hypothetical protein
MSLHLEWLGIVEGAVFDSRRALTLVGINQNVLYIDDFPTPWQTNIVVMGADDVEDHSAGSNSGTISIEIRDPSDGRISSTSNKVVLERVHKEIPGSVVAVALVGLQLTRHGRYRITAELKPDKETELSSVLHRDIFVMPKKDQPL